MNCIRHRISLVVAMNVALVAFIVDTCIKCVDSYHHPVYDGKVETREEMLLPIVYICTVEEQSFLNFHKCYVDVRYRTGAHFHLSLSLYYRNMIIWKYSKNETPTPTLTDRFCFRLENINTWSKCNRMQYRYARDCCRHYIYGKSFEKLDMCRV